MLIFKKEYNIFGNDLYYLTLAFAFVGFIKILILFLLSKNDNGYAPFLFLGIFFTLILCIFSDDYKAFINIMIYGYFVNCLLMIIYTFKKLKKIN
jgi:hypothetical protein